MHPGAGKGKGMRPEVDEMPTANTGSPFSSWPRKIDCSRALPMSCAAHAAGFSMIGVTSAPGVASSAGAMPPPRMGTSLAWGEAHSS